MAKRVVETALGPFTMTAEAGALTALEWGRHREEGDDQVMAAASSQLIEYADGKRESFDLPLAPAGGALQQAVMAEMRAIPFGETCTYGDIADRVGAAAQAVGQACGANPIPVIIPCHRVTAAAGLGGFSAPGGIDSKVKLLRHEGAYSLLI